MAPREGAGRVILAVDPGGTTGWAVRYDDGRIEYGQDAPLDFCTRAHSMLAAAHDRGEHTEVVCESFSIRADTIKKSFQPDALELIGVLRYLSHWLGADFILSPPANKALFPNDRLKLIGWYAKGMDHARDALRHLAYRSLRRGIIALPQ